MRNFVSNMIVGSTLLSIFLTISPQVLAQNEAAKHVKQLENRLLEIQNELSRIKTESAQTTQKVEQIQNTKFSVSDTGGRKKTMIFFRGGFARSDQHRNGVSIESRVAPVGAQEQADRNAWYVGAGFDFSLTNNVWGFVPKTEIVAELMFEYKQFGHGVPGNVLANAPTQLAGGAYNPRGVTVNQFTLTAAPKIKFLEGSKFRPWIIPAGLAIHVISPPSESITYVSPGIMFAGGVEYNIWKDFFIGADARYQLVPGSLDGAKFGGMTVGGYVGIGF